MNSVNFEKLRNDMVDRQIYARGITSAYVLEAMRKVPRHEFVPEEIIEQSYDDCPLPIGQGQTVSQPFMVALMSQCLKLKQSERVFEIGTGSGYQTAVLAQLCKEVCTIERIDRIFEQAKRNLQKFDYTNIKTYCGDGTQGLAHESKLFDAIIITAAAPSQPEYLFAHLAPFGRLVVPVGNRINQMLTLFTNKNGQFTQEVVCGCTFVPLIGKFGWSSH